MHGKHKGDSYIYLWLHSCLSYWDFTQWAAFSFRTYRLKASGRKRPEHNSASGYPSQNNDPDETNNKSTNTDTITCSASLKDRTIKELPRHTLANSDTGGNLDDKREMDNVDSPNNHTYAVLEGPIKVTPFQRHKTQSVAVRKAKSPNLAKRLSDTQPHVYDTLVEKAKHTPPVSNSTDELDPSAHQYAVLEGPTPPIGHSNHRHGIKQGRKESFKLSMPTNAMAESAASGYDKLPPKGITDDGSSSFQEKKESLSAVTNKTSTLTAGYDRLEPKSDTMATVDQPDMGHTYATLTPEEGKEGVKSNKGKKRSKKKQKQKHMTNQTDNSHIYDILDPQTEINSRVVATQSENEVLPPIPPRVSTASSSNTGSSRSHSVSAPHKRKISHSVSSRMLSDVSEGRKRALTVFAASSDTNLHKIVPDAEAHIYDTVEVSPAFPVSKRKQRRSGKRYRWLHLKERLERQTSLEILGSTTDAGHMTKTDTEAASRTLLTQSASLGNIMSEAVDSKPLEPSNNSCYASLDMKEVYAQVGPYLPGKGDSEQHKQEDNDKDSEYSHLKHH